MKMTGRISRRSLLSTIAFASSLLCITIVVEGQEQPDLVRRGINGLIGAAEGATKGAQAGFRADPAKAANQAPSPSESNNKGFLPSLMGNLTHSTAAPGVLQSIVQQASSSNDDKMLNKADKKPESLLAKVGHAGDKMTEKVGELLGLKDHKDGEQHEHPEHQENQTVASKTARMGEKLAEKVGDALGLNEKKDEPRNNGTQRVAQVVGKGVELVNDTLHKIGDRVQNVTGNFSQKMESFVKPTESAKNVNSTANLQQQTAAGVNQTHDMKDADSRSLIVDVLDKGHDLSKEPVEKVVRPLDKMLGIEKDPLMDIYDKSYGLVRRPLALVSKPFDSLLQNAFETVPESTKEKEAKLVVVSEQERREVLQKEEKARKDDRSIAGEIVDRVFELAVKPFEIALKPIDNYFGYKYDPVLKKVHSFYDLSRKPFDTVAKPIEKLLAEMSQQDHLIKLDDRESPLLVTRLAESAINVAEKVLSRPIELVINPIDHFFSLNEPGKNNPIVEAMHQLKNASRKGAELFTRPIDRIIAEVADIGDTSKTELERELERHRQAEQSTRVIKMLDKFHESIQKPVGYVLKPINVAVGGKGSAGKQPVLRAWDVLHELVKRPIQVVSRPIESALFGHNPDAARDWQQYKPSAGAVDGFSSASFGPAYKEERRNVITEQIKKLEKSALKPISVVTQPFRKLILATDQIEGNQRAKQNTKPAGVGGTKDDKILQTVERINNVVLRPLELMTMPIADYLDGKSQQGAVPRQQPQHPQQPQQPQH